ncbi:GTPase family protein [Budvicia aquatica]|uniref:G domain-containing protein n=3 Tax=Budvicia aquatica TaxID=82979 RepID=A0A2C6DRD0_9GAMM|nr:GTPase [Budvicia aquatica]PHI31757.1 hypothetical protein CRN84_21715 [Budvicia aquatica]
MKIYHTGLRLIEKQLTALPHDITQRILKRLESIIDYDPVIGIMGKTGVGKSSLCNALFKAELSPVSDIESCTREAQRFNLTWGHRTLTLIDLPGVGESQSRDDEYRELYSQVLPTVDLVIWVLKADDRAFSSDEYFYQHIIEQCQCDPRKVLFVLNQADKIEPYREWDTVNNQPSFHQYQNLESKIQAISECFNYPCHPIIPISAKDNYNLAAFVETLMGSLPKQASSAMTTQLKERYKTDVVIEKAQSDFGDSVDELLESMIQSASLPQVFTFLIIKVKEAIISAMKSLWSFFF